MKLRTFLLISSIAVLVGGCVTRPGDFCDVAKPQRPSRAVYEAMTGREKADLVKHNEHGEKQCGWNAR